MSEWLYFPVTCNECTVSMIGLHYNFLPILVGQHFNFLAYIFTNTCMIFIVCLCVRAADWMLSWYTSIVHIVESWNYFACTQRSTQNSLL